MTRYVLEREKVMHKCVICGNGYKNSRSLASHAYICRKSNKNTPVGGIKALKRSILDPIAETVATRNTPHQEDSNFDQSSNDSYNENAQKLPQKDELARQSDTQAYLVGGRNNSDSTHRHQHTANRPEKVRNLADHAKLIKMLCKSILDGTIPLESHHVNALKLHKKFVRKIAYNTLNLKEVRKIIQKNEKPLQTVLDIVVSILASLLV